MNKEVVSDKQGIATIVWFIIGSSSVFIMGLNAKQDLWLAIILGIFMAIPMAVIYARLHYIFPNKNLFDIIECCFGKFLGRALIFLFVCFTFYWAADVAVNYGNFINFIFVVSFDKTPMIIPIMFIIGLSGWGAKCGIEVLGRYSEFFLKVPIIFLFVSIILLIPEMDINNIQPIFYNGIDPILKGALNSFSFPFGQIVAFSMVFSNFTKRKYSPYKIYTMGLSLGGIILFLSSLMSILVIGISGAEIKYYSIYETVRRINIGYMIQSIEVIVATVFILGGFVKICILLMCTCKGIAKLFEITDYRFIVTPITLLAINLSFFQYESVMHYYKFQVDVWFYFTFLFQVFFPIVIWIVSEIKNKLSENVNRNTL
ncbi:GerAB/ArcD/ProY family transporter [Tepidibacter thalassicus]|uniref:Spore germination protein KB n=1 Tax=Tepidibacter thalassicus DSM 15285 TaxID=1123350 RepID=A0A1M5QRQ2_9FIRM|nr:endospore germination permease [Tepidibacter thalassicus]SHH16787.1 spore germination protein KB [Tepidibacter thalassicus DSM 15285]